MNNAYTDYYKELCPSEESWVHRQLSNEREKLEDDISKLRAELEVANHSIVSSLLYNTLKETCDQLRAEVAEWQRANLELHHAIQPTDGETLLGAAQTLRNEIDALNESILIQQIFSDDRIRAVEAEAELAAERKANRDLAEVISGQDKELAIERARLVDLVADLNDACITLDSAKNDCDDYAMQNTAFKLMAVRAVLMQYIPNAAMKEETK